MRIKWTLAMLLPMNVIAIAVRRPEYPAESCLTNPLTKSKDGFNLFF